MCTQDSPSILALQYSGFGCLFYHLRWLVMVWQTRHQACTTSDVDNLICSTYVRHLQSRMTFSWVHGARGPGSRQFFWDYVCRKWFVTPTWQHWYLRRCAHVRPMFCEAATGSSGVRMTAIRRVFGRVLKWYLRLKGLEGLKFLVFDRTAGGVVLYLGTLVWLMLGLEGQMVCAGLYAFPAVIRYCPKVLPSVRYVTSCTILGVAEDMWRMRRIGGMLALTLGHRMIIVEDPSGLMTG